MSLVNIKINGQPYQVESGLTVLEAARKCGYVIPSLCAFNHGKCSLASCRVCLVEVVGARGLVASCVYPVNEGMEIITNSQKAVEARRASVELILSNHQKNCLQCPKQGKCELLEVANIVGARDMKYMGQQTPATVDEVAPGIIRNTAKLSHQNSKRLLCFFICIILIDNKAHIIIIKPSLTWNTEINCFYILVPMIYLPDIPV